METLRHSIALAISICLGIQMCVGADQCKANQKHAGFEIRCSKANPYGKNEIYLTITITCRINENPSWDNFPRDLFDFDSVNKTILEKCNFPQNLSLFEKTQSLGLKRIHMLDITQPKTMLSKENLRNFSLYELNFENINFRELPFDLIHEMSTEHLRINGHSLQSIPQNFFAKAKDLKYLYIYHNQISQLKKGDFQGLDNLKKLNFFLNNLERIESGTFDGLSSLTELDLSKNRLRTLPDEIFRSLKSLETINLSENLFDSLPQDLFRSSLKLNKTRLSRNGGGLSELPKGFFRGLPKLSLVEIKRNNFSSVPEDLFEDSPALLDLDLSGNRLTEIPANLLKNASKLRKLNLSDNALRDLPAEIFSYSNLNELYTKNNQLSSLSEESLNGLGELQRLDMSFNRLSSIHPQFCTLLPKVKYLDLSHNELTNETEKSVSSNCTFLSVANLSYNKITTLSFSWILRGYLVDLNLEGNEISELNDITLKILQINMVLNLRNNRISKVYLSELNEVAQSHVDRFPNQDKNSTIYLENNPLNCDCHLLPLIQYVRGEFNKTVYRYVKIHVDDLSCASPAELEKKSINELAKDDLRCLTTSNRTTDACNATCQCWIYPSRTVPLVVDCSNRGLIDVPKDIYNPQNLSVYLNLSGNHLKTTPTGLNVTALDLSNNSITAVSKQVFSEGLRELKLHHNSITSLDSDTVQYLEDHGNLSVTLYDNEWICDCSIRDFLNVYQRILVHHQSHHKVNCANPANTTLDSLTANEICGGMLQRLVFFLILLAVFMFGLTVFVTVYFKNQERIKVWLYSKRICLWWVSEEELDKDKLYDAFISFSHLDEDFVETELIPALEGGSHPYKLCLHHRDWPVGEWVPTQIETSVQESRRTVVVLSPNFIESIWGRLEFKTAHHQALSEGRVRLIVILYGNIKMQDLDPELKGYLSMNTYLKWGDPWFWDKLRYALPHRSERRRRMPRKARLIENHLAQIPLNNHDSGNKSDVIPLPKISNASSNDSAKLLDPNSEDVRA